MWENTDLTCFKGSTQSSEEKANNLQRLAFVSSELARAGAAVITAPVAPKKVSRDAIKSTVLQSAGPGGNFFTIHVATPLEHCEARDRKGYFAKARAGEIKGVAGIDEIYEAPEKADLTVDVRDQTIPEIVHSEYFSRNSFRFASVIEHELSTGIVLLLETQSLI